MHSHFKEIGKNYRIIAIERVLTVGRRQKRRLLQIKKIGPFSFSPIITFTPLSLSIQPADCRLSIVPTTKM